ncbi:hypothetical protein GCM10023317_33180 [Actinopolymorpha pittospori]
MHEAFQTAKTGWRLCRLADKNNHPGDDAPDVPPNVPHQPSMINARIDPRSAAAGTRRRPEHENPLLMRPSLLTRLLTEELDDHGRRGTELQ